MKVKELVLNALFIAIVFVSTRFLSFGVNVGTFHAGDGVIFAIAVVYGMRSGIIAGALGMGISDLISGAYAIYTVPTIIIKTVMVIVLIVMFKKLLREKFVFVATAFAGLVGAFGYFVFEFFYYDFSIAYSMIVPNILQASVVGTILAMILIPLLDRIKKAN